MHPAEQDCFLTDVQRQRIGIAGLVVGMAIFTFGFMAAHFTGLSAENSIGVEQYPFVPRGWQWVIGSKTIALIGGQMMVIAVVFGWLFDRTMTWARAAVGATLFTLEIMVFFAIIPNEWLGLTQGEFEWTSQNVAFTLPGFLVLNNEVSISYGAIKDVVSGTYSAVLLVVVLVGIVKAQEWSQSRHEPKPPRLSKYGRPVVKGGSNG
jgi:hypothetical protein